MRVELLFSAIVLTFFAVMFYGTSLDLTPPVQAQSAEAKQAFLLAFGAAVLGLIAIIASWFFSRYRPALFRVTESVVALLIGCILVFDGSFVAVIVDEGFSGIVLNDQDIVWPLVGMALISCTIGVKLIYEVIKCIHGTSQSK